MGYIQLKGTNFFNENNFAPRNRGEARQANTTNFMSILELTTSINNLAAQLNLTPIQQVNFWKSFLAELKNGNISADSITPDSIIDYIQQNSNLEDDELAQGKIYTNIKEDCHYGFTNNFWNQSVVDAVQYFMNNLEPEIRDDAVLAYNYTLADLKNADAGVFRGYQDVWTNPDVNIQGITYIDMRNDNDAVRTVLNNNNCLQYTNNNSSDHKTLNPWLRLIMPMNVRHVEVEDLNRNFWVISIVLSILTSYLFGDENPYTEMIQKLADEITQLWENTAYLWSVLALSVQKSESGIHVEFPYISKSNFTTDKKFDNFDIDINDITNPNYVFSRIEYLRYKYPNQDLVVVPIIRKNNYQRNWYSAEYYPFVFIYLTSVNAWGVAMINFKAEGAEPMPLCFDINNQNTQSIVFSHLLSAARENTSDYAYYYSYNRANECMYYGRRLYGLARIVPEIDVEPYENGVKINSFKFKVYDAAKVMRFGDNESGLVQEVSISEPVSVQVSEELGYVVFNHIRDININETVTDTDNPQFIKSPKYKYYMGELISYYKYTDTPEFEDAKFNVVKIGDFIPSNTDFYGNLTDNDINKIYEKLTYITSVAVNDKYDTQAYGVGAMRFARTNPMGSYGAPHLKFINYSASDFYKYPTGGMEKGLDWLWAEGYQITPEVLSALSIQRVKNLVKLHEIDNNLGLPDEPAIYITKIGISYWTGDDGPQWSCGLVCNLIYYDGNGNAEDIGFIGMMDGYWTNSREVFSVDRGSKWRRLEIVGDVYIRASEDDNSNEFKINNGRVVWYDHNKEVYHGGDGQSESVRPRASIELKLNPDTNYHYLDYGIGENPLGNNRLMTPCIERPVGTHIFKENNPQLLVNQQLGVLNWKNGTYDPSDVNLIINSNFNGYINTETPV